MQPLPFNKKYFIPTLIAKFEEFNPPFVKRRFELCKKKRNLNLIDNQSNFSGSQKVTSLEQADIPKNKDELRSFLGMKNVSSIFIKNCSSITAELRRKLLHKHVKWEWND